MSGAPDIMDAVRAITEVKPVTLAYCDYIAARLSDGLVLQDDLLLLKDVGPVKSDTHPVGGYFLTTKKTIAVTDRNGRAYRITVEEVTL